MPEHCDECGGTLAEDEHQLCDGCRWTDAEIAEETPPTCPACGGPGEFLGTLGSLDHFRCRGCGITYHQTKETTR